MLAPAYRLSTRPTCLDDNALKTWLSAENMDESSNGVDLDVFTWLLCSSVLASEKGVPPLLFAERELRNFTGPRTFFQISSGLGLCAPCGLCSIDGKQVAALTSIRSAARVTTLANWELLAGSLGTRGVSFGSSAGEGSTWVEPRRSRIVSACALNLFFMRWTAVDCVVDLGDAVKRFAATSEAACSTVQALPCKRDQYSSLRTVRKFSAAGCFSNILS